MKAPAGLRKERHKHAQQQAQQRHPNKAGPIRDVAAPRTAQAPAIYLPSLSLSFSLSLSLSFSLEEEERGGIKEK
jgi:hypothetical protein